PSCPHCAALCRATVAIFHDTSQTDIDTLSLHDALPISFDRGRREVQADVGALLPLFGSDEHAVTDDDQALGGLVRHGLQYTPSRDRKSTRLNSSHGSISYAVFCLKKINLYDV